MPAALPYLAIGAGLSALALAFMGKRTSDATARGVATGGTINARLTGYWPKAAKSATERLVEGGLNDRKGKPLHSLEDHLANPTLHPYVSVAGDDSVWPYGQRVQIDAWPSAVFRVVDTGRNFRGANKVYRIAGYEPLDVNVDSPRTKVPTTARVRIFAGDNFEGGKAVAKGGLKGQTASGLDVLGLAA